MMRERFIPHILLVTLLLSFLGATSMMMWPGSSRAFMEPAFRSGTVMARSVVYDPDTGQPILVRFNEDGSEAGELSIPESYRTRIDELSIIAASDYRLARAQLEGYLAQHGYELGEEVELLSRSGYAGRTFLAADNATVISAPPLADGVHSVLVRGQAQRYSTDPDRLVLLRFSFDLTQDITVADTSVSLVVDPQGRIIAQADTNIGYRAGFYGTPTQPVDYGFSSNPDYTVYGPLSGIKVDVVHGAQTYTDSEGRYGLSFFIPCAGMSIDTTVYAELRYRSFNPTHSYGSPYWYTYRRSDYCAPEFYIMPFFMMHLGNISTTLHGWRNNNFYIDVMFLSGTLTLRNHAGEQVPVAAATSYTAFGEDAEDRLQPFYDFNNDGRFDTVVAGAMVAVDDGSGAMVERFVEERSLPAGTEPVLQGVYLSGAPEDPTVQPDLIRVMDQQARLEPIGTLATISALDLRNTDIYFFRESTGQLIVERRGLKSGEVLSSDVAATGQVNYRTSLRSPADSKFNRALSSFWSFSDWAAMSQLKGPYQSREADHIRMGEYMRVVAINRATGYTGTTRFQILSNLQGAGALDYFIPPITMVPPNLKIWAERGYEVDKGLTAGDTRTSLIGAEGAALSDDTTVTIFTEWLDESGRPLPEALGEAGGAQYGLTGRLAKITAPNVLRPAGDGSRGDDAASFPIGPGRTTQMVQVGSNLSAPEHFYVHVIGKPINQECVSGASCPSFDISGTTPPFDTRPALLTPFLTPLFDEDSHWREYGAYRQLKKDNPDLSAPPPAYSWHYRPEYQFSRFELEMQEINRVTSDEDGTEQLDNILDLTNPLITAGDELLRIFYSLFGPEFAPLTPIDGTRELVLAIGEEEQLITIGADQSIEFENLDHLSLLDPEDLLTIRLYANNDAANILWEFAFIDFSVDPTEDIEISADDQDMYLVGLVGQQDGSVVSWDVIEGNGSLSERITTSENNSVITELSTSTNPGDTYKVRARLLDVATTSGTNFVNVAQETGTITVVAGEPAEITLTASKDSYLSDNTDTIEFTAVVRDQFGNAVEDDTPVTWQVRDSTTDFITAQKKTANGQATATLQAPVVDHNQLVEVSAGTISESLEITVGRVDGTLVSNKDAINISNLETATLTVNVDAADGTPIYWQTNNGSLVTDDLIQDGQATATLTTSEAYTGGVIVTATIGDRLLLWQGRFTDNSPTVATVAHPILLAGAANDGTETFTRDDGSVIDIPYYAGTSIDLDGPPGASITVSHPTEQKVEAYTFDELSNETVTGRIAGHELLVSGATLDQTEKNTGTSSLFFNGNAHGVIAAHPDFDLTDELAVSLWVRPHRHAAGVFIDKGGVWALRMAEDGRVFASVTTAQGVFSAVSETPLPLDQWSAVGFSYNTFGLRLSVDKQAFVNATASGGLVANGSDDIRIGSDIHGHIDDLAIFAATTAVAIRVEGVDAAGMMTLDDSGRGSVRVSNTGSLGGGSIATRIPIKITTTSGVVHTNGFPFVSSAYANDDSYTAPYVIVAEPHPFFHSFNVVSSFLGLRDPGSGSEMAANVAGGLAFGIGDAGALVKNAWRLGWWSDKDPNLPEVGLAVLGLGLEIGGPLGKGVDAIVAPLRTIVGRVGNIPFGRIFTTRLKEALLGKGPEFGAAERNFITRLGGDNVLIDTLAPIIKSPELYQATIRIADKMGDGFYDAMVTIATTPGLGHTHTEAVVKTLAGVSDEVLESIGSYNYSVMLRLHESLTGLAKASLRTNPELMVKVLENNNLYTDGYKQAHLLKDLGLFTDLYTFPKFADTLKTRNIQVLGNRYELEAATYFQRNGYQVVEFSVDVYDNFSGVGRRATDVDVVVLAPQGQLWLLQAKRSEAALRGKPSVEAWVKKVVTERKKLGQNPVDYSTIKYVVPPGTRVSEPIRDYLAEIGEGRPGIEIIEWIAHK
jgi:hypothetical protein